MKNLSKFLILPIIATSLSGCFSKEDKSFDSDDLYMPQHVEYRGEYRGYEVIVNDYINDGDIDFEMYEKGSNKEIGFYAADWEKDGRFDEFGFEVPIGHELEKYLNFDSAKNVLDHVLVNYDTMFIPRSKF